MRISLQEGRRYLLVPVAEYGRAITQAAGTYVRPASTVAKLTRIDQGIGLWFETDAEPTFFNQTEDASIVRAKGERYVVLAAVEFK